MPHIDPTLRKTSPIHRTPELFFGACWYPDHWARSEWETDLRKMVDAGMTCVRWGEDAWTCVEPREGAYEWALVDEVLEVVAGHGLDLIICTPTYAAPAWLKERYPAAIGTRPDGTRWRRLTRRIYDYSDADYRRLCRGVVGAMAERYGGDERIIAWQLDNEVYCHLAEFYGPSITASFRRWLENRYGIVAVLNAAWGLRFWSCQLDHFDQVDLPGPVPTDVNQHQKLDYLRFISDLGIDFLHEQAALIRAVNPEALILHNAPMGPVDRTALFAKLDVYGIDQYPGFMETNSQKRRMSLNFGVARPLSSRLWVVEQQAAQAASIRYRNPASAPGETALLAVQSIAAGADGMIWFNWRTSPVAQECVWGGLLPPWGTPGQVYAEVCELIARLRPRAREIAASRSVVEVVRLLNHEQILYYQCEPWVADNLGDPWGGRQAFRDLELNEDQLEPRNLRPGQGYRVALLPHAIALDEGEIEAISQWVVAGGVLVVGPLAGYRDKQLHTPKTLPPPGRLGALTGTGNSVDTTWRTDVTATGADGHAILSLGRYAEVLECLAEDVVVRARYDCGWLKGLPAVAERPYGKGRVIHCGVALSNALVAWLWPALDLPRSEAAISVVSLDAEVLTRRHADYDIHFVLNHGDEATKVVVRSEVRDFLSGEMVKDPFTLPSRGWRILTSE